MSFRSFPLKFAAILSVVMITSCAAKRDYAKVVAADNIGDYENYIDEYSNSKYLADVIQRLKFLKDKRDYLEAKASGNLTAYREYLTNYPEGLYSGQAESELRDLTEKLAWKKAVADKSLRTTQQYLAEFPKGSHAQQAREQLNELKAEESWIDAEQGNSEESYFEFLKHFPNDRRSTIAKEKLNRLKEVAAWKMAKDTDTQVALFAFTKNHPNAPEVVAANHRLLELQDRMDYELALQDDTPEALQEYLDQHPAGAHMTEVREALERHTSREANRNAATQTNRTLSGNMRYQSRSNDASASITKPVSDPAQQPKMPTSERTPQNDLEEEAWSIAKNSDEVKAYETFLAEFPDGVYAEEASDRKIDKKVAEIMASDHGELPPMERQSNDSEAGSSIVTIVNDTRFPLEALYYGKEKLEMQISASGKISFTLPNGVYRIVVSVQGGRVRPFVGNESLQGGEYSAVFYIN